MIFFSEEFQGGPPSQDNGRGNTGRLFNVKYQKALLPLVDFDKSLVLEFCDLTTDQAPFLLLPPFLLILLFI